MPTRSEETRKVDTAGRGMEPGWRALDATTPETASRRSVFGNYSGRSSAELTEAQPSAFRLPPSEPPAPVLLQDAIDEAMARSFLYRYLAVAFDYPDPEAWIWLTLGTSRGAVGSAIDAMVLTGGDADLRAVAAGVLNAIQPAALDRFRDDYIAVFGHGARGSCPINEIEYGDLKADPLFQPHRLADLGGFYHAFGMSLADGGERQDHLSVELEFMAVLALREAHAQEHQLGEEERLANRDAGAKFLREHLGRWTPAFARRLARMLPESALAAVAALLLALIQEDCRRHGIRPGSEDLLLRPVDDTEESLCSSCGLTGQPPGAIVPSVAATATAAATAATDCA